MPRRCALSFFLALTALSSCGTFPEFDQTPVLLFRTGFSGTAVTDSAPQTAKFQGVDPGFESKSAWAELEGGGHIGTCLINYEDGSVAQREASIVGDPEDAANPALEFRIEEPHIVELDRMKGRVSAILEDLSGVYGFSQTIRLRLDPSLSVLVEWDRKVDWLTLFEFWCGADDRLTISLHKEEGPGRPLRWRIARERLNLFGWRRDWEEFAADDAVSFGSWLKVGIAVRVGEDGTARAWLGREEAGAWTTLVETAKAVGKPAGFTKLNPF